MVSQARLQHSVIRAEREATQSEETSREDTKTSLEGPRPGCLEEKGARAFLAKAREVPGVEGFQWERQKRK